MATMLHLHAMHQDLVAAGQAHTATAHAASSAHSAGILDAGQAWLKLEAAVCISVLPELAAAGLMLPPDEAQVRTRDSCDVMVCLCQPDACLDRRGMLACVAAGWRTAPSVCSTLAVAACEPGGSELSSVQAAATSSPSVLSPASTLQGLEAEMLQHITATWQALQQGTQPAAAHLSAVEDSQVEHHVGEQAAQQHVKAALASLLGLLWTQCQALPAAELAPQQELGSSAAAVATSLVATLIRCDTRQAWRE